MGMFKRVFSFFALLLIGAAVFVWVTKYVGLDEIWLLLKAFSGVEGFFILFLTVLMLALAALRWGAILRRQGYQVSIFHILRLYIASYSIVFFTPMVLFGAEIFRSYVIRSTHNVPLPNALLSNAIDRILEVTTDLLVIVVGFLLFLIWADAVSLKMTIIIFVVLSSCLAIIALFYMRSFQRKGILRIFFRHSRFSSAWHMERDLFTYFNWRNPALWEGLAYSGLKSTVALLRAWVLLLFLGKALPFTAALSVLAFQYMALFIPIPGSLGSHDALQAFGLQALGYSASLGPAFAVVTRSAEGLAALFGLVLLAGFSVMLIRTELYDRIRHFLTP